MTAPRFYALSWHYGVATTDDPTDSTRAIRCAQAFSFPTRAARDAWVAEGADYRTQAGYRSALSSGDRELRMLQRRDATEVARGDFAQYVRRIEDEVTP